MKKYLIVYYGDAPECVEGFHKDCKRSCEGALHVKPGRQMTVTEEELKHLKESKECKHMLPNLRILGEKKEEPKKKEEAKESKKSSGSEAAQEEGNSKKMSKKKASRRS